MTEEFLQPRSLDSSAAPQPPEPKPRRPLWIWILILAVLTGLFVIRYWSRTATEVKPKTPEVTATPVPTATPDPSLRLEAEAALESLLAITGPLRAAEPSRWAAEVWTGIETGMARGDQAMAEQNFSAARDEYQALQKPASQLAARLPSLPEELMPLAQTAYAEGRKEDALALLDIVLYLDPEHAAARSLRPRAGVADQSFALLQNIREKVEQQEWDLAWVQINRLQILDAEFPGLKALREQVSAELSEIEFQQWMSQAVLALEQGDLVSADDLVRKALRFRPQDPSLRALQQQVADKLLQQQVLELKAEAEGAAEKGDWTGAHQRWLEMKALDAGAPWIQTGLEESLRWKLLEEKIRKGMENPAGEQTGIWVAEMQEREGWPDGLKRDAVRLLQRREAALTPVPVTLISDLETRVEISRVGKWEPFLRKEIRLKPGSYTAKGIRLGYRDVRISFEVKPGQTAIQIEVICREGL